MSKPKNAWVCSQCGENYTKWQGQCSNCHQWDTITELKGISSSFKSPRGAGRTKAHWAGGGTLVNDLSNIPAGAGPLRQPTGMGELDRVLGGGMVMGSVVLISGDPGIGKSTLLLQTCGWVGVQKKVLYISGEESLQQIADRGERLEVPREHIRAAADNQLESILGIIEHEKPDLVVIDSIQTLYSEKLESAPGTVSQVRECASELTRAAKTAGFCLWLVGHVTKDGSVAGPRVLEHLVDTVLTFEGDPDSPFRLLRALKNRFGAANELGAFEMGEKGLIAVDNPSSMFLSDARSVGPGACVFVMQEGPRPILMEMQALLDDSALSNPRRLGVGVDKNRLDMLLSVLHKHGGLDIGDQDVFVNAVGGIKATEPAADLAILMCMLSSFRNHPLPLQMACFGEVGLTGEVRPVPRGEVRIREAAKLGFTHLLVPARNIPEKLPPNVEVAGVRTLAEALTVVAGWSQKGAGKKSRTPLPDQDG